METTKLLLLVSVLAAISIVTFSSCSYLPKGTVAVKPFDSKKYIGLWYEIARFDFYFEKNLNNTTANYSFNKNGTIKVVNRGYNYVTQKWKQSVGKAKFVRTSDEGSLKVSFFGPFYGGYNVIAIDSAYRYALVAGSNFKYLWILSREKIIPENIKQAYLSKAKSLGFATENLIWVEHNK